MSELPNKRYTYAKLPTGEFTYSEFHKLIGRHIRHHFGRFVNANSDSIPMDARTENNGIRWFADLVGEDYATVKALTLPIRDSAVLRPSQKILDSMGAVLNEESVLIERTVEEEVLVWSVSIGDSNGESTQ